MFVLKIHADSFENPFNNQRLQCICGDFNCVLNPEIDYSNYKHINNKNARDILLKNIHHENY